MSNLEKLIIPFKRVVLIGPPKSGKTYHSQAIRSRHVIHCDDVLGFGPGGTPVKWDEQDHFMLNYIKAFEGAPYLCEGVAGYRMLRTGLGLGWEPDAVILLKDREHHRMSAALATIFNKYLSMGPRAEVFQELSF